MNSASKYYLTILKQMFNTTLTTAYRAVSW